MVSVWDVLLLLLIAVALPVRAWRGMSRLRRESDEAMAALRPRYHLRGIVSQWTVTGLVVTAWWLQGRDLGDLALRPHLTYGLIGTLVGLAILVPVVRHQVRGLTRDDLVAARLRERLEPARHLLPHRASEWPRFALFAVTAGVCEELLFRGFVAWVLMQWCGPWPGLALQAVLFGVAHAYQGRAGMLRTGFAGAFLTALLVITGSLWASMLFHALMDLHAGHLALRLYGSDEPGDGADAVVEAS